jgi:pantoate--beta-alanine ligase
MLQMAAARLRDGDHWEGVRADGLNFLSGNGLQPEYFEAVDAESLVRQTNHFSGKKVALCVAAYVESVRLIDNLILGGS